MPTKAHRRSRSSIDQVIDLLADLEDKQIALLLDDFNHTTPSNVPVTEAIALFEHQTTNPRRLSGRSSSPVRTLQAELERRHSRRISSAPEPRPRPRTTSKPQAPRCPTPAKQSSDRPDRPSLVLSPPGLSERPESSNSSPSLEPPRSRLRSRSYKRISRPMLLSPTATAELHHLLLAYFSDAPDSSTTTATPSPTTPNTGCSFLSPFSLLEPEPELISPGLDLLEPSPTRIPTFPLPSTPARSLRTTHSMSSLFEVLRSQ
ncbi:hypothetical protein BT67DRAFT_119133 [Trichocladium antarcticum]|uniref:Uncharacterized protein n=1 Tax=Trichocladium antarcticum TaxID=1450529 RepID=A0AAN6UR86_9PEZI|nr:hypothetical protein BT67DRAFT_119133 [Trichocladium antarcticum]